MYQADKIRFVNETYPDSEQSRKWVLSTLNLLSEYEAMWNMDFTMQEYETLQAAFNHVTAMTYNGAKSTLTRFRKYAKWRTNVGLPCGDGVFRLEADRAVAMRDSMVSSPKHLSEVLNAAFDDPVLGTIDIIYRVFLWMGFSGLNDLDAVRVTSDEVDFLNMTISHAGATYPIYDESKYDFRIACDLMEFNESTRRRKRVEGNEIMRGKENKRVQSMESALVSSIRPTLARKFAEADRSNQESEHPAAVGFDLTFSRIQMSGTFYRLYQRELDGYPPDFAQFAIDEFDRIERSDKPYKVSPSNPKYAILSRIRRSVESDYESWKRAFSL